MSQIDFRYAPTLREAFNCKMTDPDADVVLIRGPVESGKSVCCVALLLAASMTIPRGLDGIRRSKWLIARSSYPELRTGTAETWKQWCPEDVYGDFEGTEPFYQRHRYLDVDATFEFRSFRDDSDAVLKTLRSTEYTGGWFNESQYTPLKLITQMIDRTGRFPAAKDCPDYERRKFFILDMNAPPKDDHWSLYMTGQTPIPDDMDEDEAMQYRMPPNWRYFEQPPAVAEVKDAAGKLTGYKIHPLAENIPYAGAKKVLAGTHGKRRDDIRRDLMNQVVANAGGKPRYQNFQIGFHGVDTVEVIDKAPIIGGWDPGRKGALTLWQLVDRQWRAIYEQLAKSDGSEDAETFLDRARFWLNTRTPWWKESWSGFGDVFGQRAGATNETWFTIAQAMGMSFHSPWEKDRPDLRWEVGDKLMSAAMAPVGAGEKSRPRLLVGRRTTPKLYMGLNRGLAMKEVSTGQKVRYVVDKKNPFADVVESAEYAWVGGGESYTLTIGSEATRPQAVNVLTDYRSEVQSSRVSMWRRRRG